MKFHKQWRLRNTHNQLTIGSRTFPINVVEGGKGSYGALNVQSLFEQSGEKLKIGNFVSIAPGVQFLLGVNHQMNTLSTYPMYSKKIEASAKDARNKGEVIIEDEAWLGTDALIFSGVTIGKGAIVAARAVVTKDVPPYAIVGGNPAKVIKYKFSPEIIEVLKPIYLVDLEDGFIKENIELLYSEIETVEDAQNLKEKLMNTTNG
jgi:acetyltransferase-like isoleucine patch superfamily enzyme